MRQQQRRQRTGSIARTDTIRLVSTLEQGCGPADDDDDRHRRQVVERFLAARAHVDRVIAILEVGHVASPASRGPSGRLRVSESIADAIASLDLAFELWLDDMEDPAS
jgi:hypothetical protein